MMRFWQVLFSFLAGLSALTGRVQAETSPPPGRLRPDAPHWSIGAHRPDGLERLSATRASLAERRSDGIYGRLNGDLEFTLGLGAELGAAPVSSAAHLAIHYFSTAGLYFDYRDAWGTHRDPSRALSFGVSVRPLFIPRWSNNWERGPAFLDLALDSLALSLGTFWEERSAGPFGRHHGFEMGAGFGLPLLARAPGPWLECRGVVRFGDPSGGPLEAAQGALRLTLTWHAFVETPLLRRNGSLR